MKMNMKVEISVIVPAHNVGNYIGDAFESLLNQNFKDWEALVVEDGSEDNTLEVCRRYSALDSRIKLISAPSSSPLGPAAARNIALDAAAGNWIVCLDADDVLPPAALAKYLDLQKRFNADIVQASFRKFKSDELNEILNSEYSNSRIKKEKIEVTDGVKALENSLYQRRDYHNSVWGALFRRSLFENERFRNGILYEDLDIFYRLALRSEVFVHTSAKLYLYRNNPGSILHRFHRGRLDVLDVTKNIEQFVEKNYPQLIPAARDRRFAASFNMYRLMNSQPDSIDYAADIAAAEDYIKRHAPAILFGKKNRLKNRLGALSALLLPKTLLRSLLSLY